ncbi:MAG: ribonuclease HII [Thermoplasmata archaeon]
MLCGIDEAGRGPVIGPMVIAVVCGHNETFRNIGAKDSKLLTEGRRESILSNILETSEYHNFIIIGEEEIDEAVSKNLLNFLEAKHIASLMQKGNSYIVDCPDINEARFKKILSDISGIDDIIAEHKADINYPVVSAASILAKVTREREIEKIKKEIGDFGSGYPSDPRTINFLREYYKKNHVLPLHTRKSWKTVKNITGTLDWY